MAKTFITVSVDIMRDKNLSFSQKFILAEIHQLVSLDRGCIASNRHFAELIGLSKQAVSNAINDLEKKGYIVIDNRRTKRNVGRRIYLAETGGDATKTTNPNDDSPPIHDGVPPIHDGVPPIHDRVPPIQDRVQSKGIEQVNRTVNRTVRKTARENSTGKKFKLTPEWKPDEKKLTDYLAFAMIKIDDLKPEWISEFYSYWALGGGSTVERTDGEWLKKYVDTMIKWARSPGLFDKLNGYSALTMLSGLVLSLCQKLETMLY